MIVWRGGDEAVVEGGGGEGPVARDWVAGVANSEFIYLKRKRKSLKRR